MRGKVCWQKALPLPLSPSPLDPPPHPAPGKKWALFSGYLSGLDVTTWNCSSSFKTTSRGSLKISWMLNMMEEKDAENQLPNEPALEQPCCLTSYYLRINFPYWEHPDIGILTYCPFTGKETETHRSLNRTIITRRLTSLLKPGELRHVLCFLIQCSSCSMCRFSVNTLPPVGRELGYQI